MDETDFRVSSPGSTVPWNCMKYCMETSSKMATGLSSPQENGPTFYVGQHEDGRDYAITDDVFERARRKDVRHSIPRLVHKWLIRLSMIC